MGGERGKEERRIVVQGWRVDCLCRERVGMVEEAAATTYSTHPTLNAIHRAT